MRYEALAGLVLLVGCNRIFGITETQPWDAQIPIDVVEAIPHATLAFQVAASLPDGTLSVTDASLASVVTPKIRIAPIGMPEVALQDVVYLADKPGWIKVPDDYFKKNPNGVLAPWRLEYTVQTYGSLPNVPHEVQWAPEDEKGHLTVPIAGRIARDAVMASTGYHIAAPAGVTFTMPVIYTTGMWSQSATAPSVGATIDYDLKNAAWLSPPEGRPDQAKGDRALLVDFIADTVGASASMCRIATGWGQLPDATPTVASAAPQSVAWHTTRQAVPQPDVVASARVYSSRLQTALGPRFVAPLDPTLSVQLFGIVPSLGLPGLMASSSSLSLPVPVMLPLLQCPFMTATLPPTAQLDNAGSPLADFPRVFHVQLVDVRRVTNLGLNLISGMETVLPLENGGFHMAFPAAIATQITLTTPSGAMVDLSSAPDQAAVGGPSGTFTLTFVPESGIESGNDLSADYHEIVLHRITPGTPGTPGSLSPVRVYVVTQPVVRIDGSAVLAANTDYVFEIRSYKGHPNAAQFDFATVAYPYGAAIVFTTTFKTQ